MSLMHRLAHWCEVVTKIFSRVVNWRKSSYISLVVLLNPSTRLHFICYTCFERFLLIRLVFPHRLPLVQTNTAKISVFPSLYEREWCLRSFKLHIMFCNNDWRTTQLLKKRNDLACFCRCKSVKFYMYFSIR